MTLERGERRWAIGTGLVLGCLIGGFLLFVRFGPDEAGPAEPVYPDWTTLPLDTAPPLPGEARHRVPPDAEVVRVARHDPGQGAPPRTAWILTGPERKTFYRVEEQGPQVTCTFADRVRVEANHRLDQAMIRDGFAHTGYPILSVDEKTATYIVAINPAEWNGPARAIDFLGTRQPYLLAAGPVELPHLSD